MLAKLKARLKELTAANDILLAKGESMNAEDLAALKKQTDEIESTEQSIADLERAEAARARSALPATAPAAATAASVPATPAVKLTTVEKVGLVVFGMASAYKQYGKGSAHVFKTLEERGYGEVAKEFADVTQRALNSGAASAGGVLLPEQMSSEIIDVLRPTTTFLQGNPRRVPLVNGAYKLPAAAASSTAAWRGEGQAVQASQPTFKDINLVAKFLDSLVPLTNQLVRWSLPDVAAWVRRDMALTMGVALDSAAYFGAGTAHTPLGITKVGGVFRETALGATTPTVAQIETGARTLELRMENSNLMMLSTAWVMAPRTLRYLADLRDGNGNLVYPRLQDASPSWRGRPVFKTTQVSITGGASTDESELLLVNFDDIYLGEGAGLSFSVSTEASYVKNGVTISAFQNDLTLIKASMEADVDMAYTEAVAVLEEVRWGA